MPSDDTSAATAPLHGEQPRRSRRRFLGRTGFAIGLALPGVSGLAVFWPISVYTRRFAGFGGV